jgi:hypothetical protein
MQWETRYMRVIQIDNTPDRCLALRQLLQEHEEELNEKDREKVLPLGYPHF